MTNTAFRVSLVLAVSMVLVACTLAQTSPQEPSPTPAPEVTVIPLVNPDTGLPSWAKTITDVVNLNNEFLYAYMSQYLKPGVSKDYQCWQMISLCGDIARFGEDMVDPIFPKFVREHGGCPEVCTGSSVE